MKRFFKDKGDKVNANNENDTKNNDRGITEIVMILDRSGSMGGLESDTIGGFNSFIDKQKKEEGEAFVSVVLFDDVAEILYDRAPIQKVEKMNDRQYFVRGCTALLDAVGGAVKHTVKAQRKDKKDSRPDKTLFVIITDGLENASIRFTYREVKDMIEHEKEKYGWEFIFLGANIDAAAEAQRFGIHASRAAKFSNDSRGQKLNYDTVSKVVGCMRAAPCSSDISAIFEEEDMLADIREDNAKRGDK